MKPKVLGVEEVRSKVMHLLSQTTKSYCIMKWQNIRVLL